MLIGIPRLATLAQKNQILRFVRCQFSFSDFAPIAPRLEG